MFFAKITGAELKKFKIKSLKMCMSYDCSKISYKKEILVCAGGVIFNFASALISMLFLKQNQEGVSFFALCSISIAIINIYPISTLDGGGILKSVTLSFFDENLANSICKVISFIAVFVLWICAVYLQLIFDANVSLLFISIILLVEFCFSA